MRQGFTPWRYFILDEWCCSNEIVSESGSNSFNAAREFMKVFKCPLNVNCPLFNPHLFSPNILHYVGTFMYVCFGEVGGGTEQLYNEKKSVKICLVSVFSGMPVNSALRGKVHIPTNLTLFLVDKVWHSNDLLV